MAHLRFAQGKTLCQDFAQLYIIIPGRSLKEAMNCGLQLLRRHRKTFSYHCDINFTPPPPPQCHINHDI